MQYKGYTLNDYNQEPWYDREILLFKSLIDTLDGLDLSLTPNLVLYGQNNQDPRLQFNEGKLNLGTDGTSTEAMMTIRNSQGFSHGGTLCLQTSKTSDDAMPELTLQGGTLGDQDGCLYLGNQGLSVTLQPGYHGLNFPNFIQLILHAGQTLSNAGMYFQNQSGERLIEMDASGNVGIGTAPTASRLCVAGDPGILTVKSGSVVTNLISIDNTTFLTGYNGSGNNVVVIANPVTRLEIAKDGTCNLYNNLELHNLLGSNIPDARDTHISGYGQTQDGTRYQVGGLEFSYSPEGEVGAEDLSGQIKFYVEEQVRLQMTKALAQFSVPVSLEDSLYISGGMGSKAMRLSVGLTDTELTTNIGSGNNMVISSGTDGTCQLTSLSLKLDAPKSLTIAGVEDIGLPTGWSVLAINNSTGEVRRVNYPA